MSITNSPASSTLARAASTALPPSPSLGQRSPLASSTLSLQRTGSLTPSTSDNDLAKRSGSSATLATATDNSIIFENTLSSVLNDPGLILFEKMKVEANMTRRSTFTMPPIEPSTFLVQVNIDWFAPYLQRIKEPLRLLMGLRAERSAALIKHWNNKTPNSEPVENEKLKKIPQIYFEQVFHMYSSDTFASIFEVDNLALQGEKLSMYLDIVELEITERISRRSVGFFNALHGLQRLHSQVYDVCQQTEEIRSSVQLVDNALVKDSLAVVQMRNRRKRFDQIMEMMQTIRVVNHAPPNIDLLIANNDYFEALKLIKITSSTIQEKLAGVVALHPTVNFLKEATSRVETKMSNKMLDLALGGEEELDEDLTADLTPLISELFLTGRLPQTLIEYKEKLVVDFKELITKVVIPPPVAKPSTNLSTSSTTIVPPSAAASAAAPPGEPGASAPTEAKPAETDKVQILQTVDKSKELEADTVKSLDVHAFVTKLRAFYKIAKARLIRVKSILACISATLLKLDDRRKKAVEEMGQQLQAILDQKVPGLLSADVDKKKDTDVSALKAKSFASEKEYLELHRQRVALDLESSSLLTDTFEVVHTFSARVLKVRGDLHRRLPLEQFALVHFASDEFVHASELIAGKKIKFLRSTVNSQMKSYLENFHTNKVTTVRHILDAELWEKAEVAREFPTIFACLVDPEVSLRLPENQQAPSGGHATSPAGKEDNLKVLVVVGEKYFVVTSLLLFARFLHEYLICVDTIPAVGQDIVTRFAEILQLFNKRVSELVLGKEAIKTAGLKAVTASHLGLSSQCLSLLIHIIPNLNERLRRYLQPSQHKLLEELDRVFQDYVEHRQRIFNKFISIMAERVDDMIKAYKLDDTSKTPSAAVQTLIKKTNLLLGILRPILPASQLKKIFRQVFIMYNEKIIGAFSKFSLRSDNEKTRIRTDVNYLWQQMNAMDMGEPGDDLIAFVAKVK